MRLALFALLFVLVAGCTSTAPQSPATPAASPAPTLAATATPAASATATPAASVQATATPVPKDTYLNLESHLCNPENMVFELWNTGMYATGKPLMRLYKIEGGQKTATCMEFTLPFEILKNGKKEFMLFNKDYGVDKCDYSSGSYRLEVVQPDAAGVSFKAIEIACS